MYKVNKILLIPASPHKTESVELTILKTVEKTLTLAYPLSHVDSKELPRKDNKYRRFFIGNAYGYRDK